MMVVTTTIVGIVMDVTITIDFSKFFKSLKFAWGIFYISGRIES